uniref:Uncharacterized protein n=1 Tax=Lepeophtheirus salmonis TaxID=72036 RepID=A0A0K2V0L2_LEPSM
MFFRISGPDSAKIEYICPKLILHSSLLSRLLTKIHLM